MNTQRRYHGRKPREILSKVCRSAMVIGFCMVLGAAGNSDAGAPLSQIVPLVAGGLALVAAGGCFGGVFV